MSEERENPTVGGEALASGVDPKPAFYVHVDGKVDYDSIAAEAAPILEKEVSTVSEFWKTKYDVDACRNWETFYKRNSANFWKDRNYLHLAYPFLMMDPVTGTLPTSTAEREAPGQAPTGGLECDADGPALRASRPTMDLVAAGCGTGSEIWPLLSRNLAVRAWPFDFSSVAVNLLQEQEGFDKDRIHPFVCDFSKDDLPLEPESMDGGLMVFVLSALAPETFPAAIERMVKVLRPGGLLMFRDYGRYDLAQIRFATKKPGYHKLDENFYVRHDGTRCYYFSLEDVKKMFGDAGLEEVKCEWALRSITNRAQKKEMKRVWVHAVFRKPVPQGTDVERLSVFGPPETLPETLMYLGDEPPPKKEETTATSTTVTSDQQ